MDLPGIQAKRCWPVDPMTKQSRSGLVARGHAQSRYAMHHVLLVLHGIHTEPCLPVDPVITQFVFGMFKHGLQRRCWWDIPLGHQVFHGVGLECWHADMIMDWFKFGNN